MFDQRSVYFLEANNPTRLEISWGFFRPFVIVYLDGQEIGRIKRSKLSYPQKFTLNDNRQLVIQERPSFQVLGMGFYPYLHITLEGEELPGLKVSGEQKTQEALSWFFFMGIIKLIAAILVSSKTIHFPIIGNLSSFLEWRLGFTGSLLVSLVYFGFFFLPKRYKNSALIIGLGLMSLDFILEICSVFLLTKHPINYILTVQVLAIISFYRALMSEPSTV